MKKTYVVDTNVLVQSPYGLYAFEENEVVIPLVVVEELDGLKKAEGEKGANARKAIRLLDSLRQRGNLLSGVPIQNGGTVRVETNCVDVTLPRDLPENESDNRILMVCKGLKESDPCRDVVLVTKDIVLRIKAQLLSIRAEDFEAEQVSRQEANYTGRGHAYLPQNAVGDFKNGGVPLSILYRVSAFFFTSSIVPTLKKAASGYASISPSKIALNPRIVSLTGTNTPLTFVKFSATWNGCDRKRCTFLAR